MQRPNPSVKKQSASKGLTPNKQKRRPGGGNPSPAKPFSIKGTKSK